MRQVDRPNGELDFGNDVDYTPANPADWFHIDTIRKVVGVAALGGLVLGLVVGWWFL